MASTDRNDLLALEKNLKEVLLHSHTVKGTLGTYILKSSTNHVSGLILVPLIKKALLEDETFKKECLCSIAKQFDINQVLALFCMWKRQMKMYNKIAASLQCSDSRE